MLVGLLDLPKEISVWLVGDKLVHLDFPAFTSCAFDEVLESDDSWKQTRTLSVRNDLITMFFYSVIE